LPKDLPRIHDLRFAARYLAGGTGLDVGGDWYDVQEIDAGKTIISIGDVVGRGVFAAAAMGQFRNMLNAYAIEGVGPARTLERMNEVVLRTAGERYATVAYLIFDHVAHTLTYARAGHPPPLLLQPDGAVQMLDETTDMPVGVWPKSTYEERTVAFTPGSTLLLYTDGLVETRDRDMHTGILQLAEHFAKAPTEPEDLADNLLREFAPDRSDDTAILIVRHLSAKDTLGNRWRCEQFDAREATRLRGEILEQLEALAEPGQDLFEAALALGEVLGNVARHAPGEASIVLDWHGTRPIIAVADRGPGLSNEISQAPLDTDVLRESGRGLELIRRHVAAFEVRPRAGGGMVAEIHLELVRRRNRTQ
jgi:anti-sigma regulatory factor (Ser/Thr protein kinase)